MLRPGPARNSKLARGVAVLAALLVNSGSTVGPFADVYVFCTLATFAVAAMALCFSIKEKR